MKFDNLKCGTWIKYSGTVITMRDLAHKRISDLTKKGIKLPFDIKDKVILYAAATKSKKDIVIGPTTSTRMDKHLELIIKLGISATIGKGNRSNEAIQIIKKYKRPYFVLLSGMSAYLSKYFIKERIIGFHDLGVESIKEYEVKDLPLLVAIDSNGNSVYKGSI